MTGGESGHSEVETHEVKLGKIPFQMKYYPQIESLEEEADDIRLSN